jgi:hypothetical protein
MTRRPALFALLTALLMVPTLASADGLTGTTVSGQFNIGGASTNYFDPSNGFVPSGFQNDAGPTVVINGSPTFGFNDSFNFDQANFTDSTLTISDLDQPSAGALNWEMVFTDSAFAGASVSKVSDTFDNGGLSVNLVGDDLTVSWVGDTVRSDFDFSAAYDIATVPEPLSLVLLGIGLLGLISWFSLKWRGDGFRQ